jgi:hypothetical protein
MTGTAIIVDATGCLGIGWVAVAGIGFVLVIVMAEMLGGGARLMLAINPHRRPAKLKRQKKQQENGEQAAHLKIIPETSGMPAVPPAPTFRVDAYSLSYYYQIFIYSFDGMN